MEAVFAGESGPRVALDAMLAVLEGDAPERARIARPMWSAAPALTLVLLLLVVVEVLLRHRGPREAADALCSAGSCVTRFVGEQRRERFEEATEARVFS